MFPFDRFSPRAKLEREVRKRYGPAADAALRELDRYTGSPAADRDRVHRAILALADDSLANLARWVTVALSDYRDVLGPASAPDPRATTAARELNAWNPDRATLRETSFAALDDEPGDER